MSNNSLMLTGLLAVLSLAVAVAVAAPAASAASSSSHLPRHRLAAAHFPLARPTVPWAFGNWVNGVRPRFAYPGSVWTYDPACGLPSSACPNNERNLD